MKEWRSKEGWIIGGFIIGSELILFLNLWGRSLENHGYIQYAEIAREMVSRGDWILMHYNGKTYPDKPPLFFWLVNLSVFFLVKYEKWNSKSESSYFIMIALVW
jgi:4-amino-4-deoxy-L-arabinose transferase-like glycosyltransferase